MSKSTNVSTLTKEQFIQALQTSGACSEGIEWCRDQTTPEQCWNSCERPDWLLFLLQDVCDIKDDRRYRKFACQCVRRTPVGDDRIVWDLLTDERSRRVVEVAELYAAGKATENELNAARAAVWDAARAAARAAQADILRKLFTWEEVEEVLLSNTEGGYHK